MFSLALLLLFINLGFKKLRAVLFCYSSSYEYYYYYLYYYYYVFGSEEHAVTQDFKKIRDNYYYYITSLFEKET